jgi:hypothetical protein
MSNTERLREINSQLADAEKNTRGRQGGIRRSGDGVSSDSQALVAGARKHHLQS